MAENYKEQQQEETEGVVDAGGFEDDPGTGMVAEDQETAAAGADAVTFEEEPTAYGDEEAIADAEASEQVQVDLHENSGSGIDVTVIVVILLIIIGCLSFAIASAPTEEEQQVIALQEAMQKATNPEHEVPYEVVELPEGVAAMVNGEAIAETTIDDYMAGFRLAYGVESDEDWASWLIAYGYTPEQIRDVAISIFVDQTLVRQGIEEYGIDVPQEDIDAIYDSVRQGFATEEEWQEGLKEARLTEEAFRQQCEQQAAQQALQKYLGDRWFATPEDKEAELLVAVKQYYPKYADVESLDGISEEELAPVREMVDYYAQSDAYNKYMSDAKENGDIKMSAAPSDLPYDANLLLGLFQNLALQFQAAQETQAAQQ